MTCYLFGAYRIRCRLLAEERRSRGAWRPNLISGLDSVSDWKIQLGFTDTMNSSTAFLLAVSAVTACQALRLQTILCMSW
jgi:hypothetical protein